MNYPKKMRQPWHLEPQYAGDLGKPLIINVATGQQQVFRSQNPNQPYTPQEMADQVIEAYEAGATVCHAHMRDEDGVMMYLSREEWWDLNAEFQDKVLKYCPDIIFNTAESVGWDPIKYDASGNMIDIDSVGPKSRLWHVDKLIEKAGGTPRLIEFMVVSCSPYGIPMMTLFEDEDMWDPEQFAISPEVQPVWVKNVEFMQERGIIPEIILYGDVSLNEVKEWLVDTGVLKPPYLFSIILGIHNSFPCIPTEDGIEHLVRMKRHLPKGAIVETICGGRNSMAMTAASVMTGVDMVRVGVEDGIYKYPHKDDPILSIPDQVRRTKMICDSLGREIATPEQARKILGLPQIKK